MRRHTVKGAGGTSLAVHEAGRNEGPTLLLVHGLAQSHQCWQRQLEGPLAQSFRLVAMDLRGHGQSDKPQGQYQDSRLWAEDVHAVLTTLKLERPVLVGWSYGGFVVADYLRHYGEGAVAGVHLVAPIILEGSPEAFSLLTPDFLATLPGLLSPEPAVRTQALESFVSLLVHRPLSPEKHAEVLAYNRLVPAYVMEGIATRAGDQREVLPKLTVPVLLSHGQEDRIVLPECSRQLAALMPRAQLSLYPDVGHSPFLEDTARFERELADFARRCQ
jgi:pimeloyl-ACP methyl ester carboxylesterase